MASRTHFGHTSMRDVGGQAFFTESRVEQADGGSEIASTTNHSAFAAAWTTGAGVYVPLRTRAAEGATRYGRAVRQRQPKPVPGTRKHCRPARRPDQDLAAREQHAHGDCARRREDRTVSATRWVKRVAAGAGVVAVAALLSGASYERAMRERSIRDFPAPGRLVDVGGGRRIQLDCRGDGSPTVVLESGLDTYGSLAWASVHDSIAATTRVCAYSRAGIMWSDPTSGPFDSRALANDLHTALTRAGEKAPWVMVGHSLGGPYVTRIHKVVWCRGVGCCSGRSNASRSIRTLPRDRGQVADAVGRFGALRCGRGVDWSRSRAS